MAAEAHPVGEDPGSSVSARSVEPAPRLHAVWRSGAVGFWCDSGLGRPLSVAPASRPEAVGRVGAPTAVVEALSASRGVHRLGVTVPVEGRVRSATVPGVLLGLGSALRVVAQARVPAGGEPPAWAGPGLAALDALSWGVLALVRAGYVVPSVVSSIEGWEARWVLTRSPVVEAWVGESSARCHGLVTGREELRGLVDALADHHARVLLTALPRERRSVVGDALSSVDPSLLSGGSGLARAAADLARAAAALRVDVVLRVLEPGGEDSSEGEAGQILWRLEVLVRTGDAALRPYSELPDPAVVADTVSSVLSVAERAWPPLSGARRVRGGVDLLVPSETVLALVDEGAEVLRGRGVEVLLPRAWTRVRTAVRVEVADSGSGAVDTGRRVGLEQLADVDWDMLVDGESLDAGELDLLLAQASDLVRLRGRWVRADAEALRRAARFLAARTGDRRGLSAVVAAVASEEASGLEIVGPSTLRWAEAAGTERLELPDWFAAILRPYQREGLDWLSSLSAAGVGAVLADDMGLGKTVQVLALTAAEIGEGGGGHDAGATLVVAPLSLVATWRREAARFAPRLRILVHHGPGRAELDDGPGVFAGADLVLTSYGTASRDVEVLRQVRWRRLVADEAQTVKNSSTAVSRALRTLDAAHRVALTGTPVENRLDELRAVLDFANPGVFGSASTFRARFAVPVESHRDPTAVERLRTVTAPFVLRRVKSDPRVAADLPDKQIHRVDTPLTREQGTLYKAVVEDMLENVRSSGGMGRKGAVLAGLTALKQVCNHPAHYLDDGSSLLRGGRHRSGKVAEIDRLLSEIGESGERTLVFTQYRAFGEMVLPLLSRRAGVEVPFLHGGVGPAGRAEMVERFQSEQGPPVMLASLKAGGTGLTLTAANHVVHLDRWWNPAVEAQATDRVHRIGQTRTVQVHTFVTPGTVEERIDELMDAKSELADLTIGPLAGRLTELSDADLTELVRLSAEGVGQE